MGNQKTWRVQPPLPPQAAPAFKGYPPLLAQLLYNRGLRTPGQAQAFLAGAPVSHDPFTLPDMPAAVERLGKAVRQGERIAVFGDFDVDGVSATALLATALRPLGIEVIPYLPRRIEEGHGLSPQAVEYLAQQGVTLLVTVDCGISSAREIEAAARAGMDTIVTDHHLPPTRMPPALAVVDPRLPGSRYPFLDLTGAGLALKLAQGLYTHMGYSGDDTLPALLTLAALGTVADVAPLLDENRSIVRQGLHHLARAPSPGLQALLSSARLGGRPLDTEAVGWLLAPRLNASGRMDHAGTSYRLLVTPSPQEAQELASTLELQNQQRQRLTEETYQRAKSIMEPAPLLMVGDAAFPPGIIGLVAGRLAEEFARPAVVVSLGEDFSRGSCRSAPWFNIGQALYRVAEGIGGFARHGGHAQAAGFTVETARLGRLKEALVDLAQEALAQVGAEQPPQPWIDVDMEAALGALPRDIYPLVQSLAPFGPGNPEPVFLSRRVQLLEARPMGAGGQHLRLNLRGGGVTWRAVAFGQSDRLPPGARSLDIVYAVDMDYWGGAQTLQLRLLDFRAAS